MCVTHYGLASTSGWNRKRVFTAVMKRFVLNGSERTDGRFTAAFFETQPALFSVRCGGDGTRKNVLLARMSGKTTARPPVFVCLSKQVHTSLI